MMAGLIALRPGVDWTATGGLFDWALEYLIARLSDREAADRLQEVVDNNLGSVWFNEFPAQTQHEIAELLRGGLVAAAEQELPDGEHKPAALRHLRDLVDLTQEA